MDPNIRCAAFNKSGVYALKCETSRDIPAKLCGKSKKIDSPAYLFLFNGQI